MFYMAKKDLLARAPKNIYTYMLVGIKHSTVSPIPISGKAACIFCINSNKLSTLPTKLRSLIENPPRPPPLFFCPLCLT